MKNLSIKIKVVVGFIFVMLMFIIVVGTTTSNIKQLKSNSLNVKHLQNIILRLDLISSEAKICEIASRGYIITGDSLSLGSYPIIKNDSLRIIKVLKRISAHEPELLSGVTRIGELFQMRLDEVDVVIKARNEEGSDAAIKHMNSRVMSEMRILLRDISNEKRQLLAESEVTVVESMEKVKVVIKWMFLGSSLIVLILIIYINHAIVDPIKRLSKKAEDIALGNLTNVYRRTDRGDEIGLLVSSFIKMQSNLMDKAKQAEEIANGNLTINVTPLSDDDIFGKAFGAMIQMFNSQMHEIQQGVNVLSTASNEMMAIMSQLASGSSETASSVSETSATIEEIKQTTEISSKKADEVTASSRKLASVSHDGNEAVQQSIGGMNKIKQQMESIATIVIQLSEKSHKIGEIANAVNDIAEQSNLLAVNASIEAAKAGEEGKGFAVVAQEIKNLARRSKSSTVEITTILTDIQKEISSAVMATEQGGKVIDEGLTHSFKVSDTISALASNAEDSLQANMLISASSQQQLVGMEQITVAMESIREASVQNSNSTNQAEVSVSELTELGSRLIKLLSRYKFKDI